MGTDCPWEANIALLASMTESDSKKKMGQIRSIGVEADLHHYFEEGREFGRWRNIIILTVRATGYQAQHITEIS